MKSHQPQQSCAVQHGTVSHKCVKCFRYITVLYNTVPSQHYCYRPAVLLPTTHPNPRAAQSRFSRYSPLLTHTGQKVVEALSIQHRYSTYLYFLYIVVHTTTEHSNHAVEECWQRCISQSHMVNFVPGIMRTYAATNCVGYHLFYTRYSTICRAIVARLLSLVF